MTQSIGTLTPVSSVGSTMAILVAKPSAGDATKKDFGAIAAAAFATPASVATALTPYSTTTQMTTAISAAVSGIGSANLVIDQTYTANGAIDTTKTFVVFNSSTALTMTLANGSSNRGAMVLKNIGTGLVSITANVDGASSTLALASTVSVTLAWSVAQATYEVVGSYDPQVTATAMATATLGGTLLVVLVDPATGIAYKTTLAALKTFILA